MLVVSYFSLGKGDKLLISSSNESVEFNLVEGGEFIVIRENTTFKLFINTAFIEDGKVHVVYYCQFDGDLGFGIGELSSLSFSVNESKSYSCNSDIKSLYILRVGN
ncbi:hypothetical protein N473_08575 [Pseudoalteromonas luteoviolacea CPMOR-1]|uniref:Uncharacterized protein n=2 Tax=Pseudoalteromonas luteoviolacea TaxID=43657 RepID=A0A167MHR9_9GAMM|nr:hypothetical protein N473_08575 [Pseudoalteromonas luteoviolacea CPMOR-1]